MNQNHEYNENENKNVNKANYHIKTKLNKAVETEMSRNKLNLKDLQPLRQKNL